MQIGYLQLQQNAGIATITLNHPEKGNALDGELIQTLTQTLQQLAHDEAIQVIVLAANGKHFCAGADLHWMQQSIHFTEQENTDDAQQLTQLLQTLYELPKPTIAQVHGAIIGGGIGLAACCDIVVAAEKTFMQFSEVRLGLIPAIISPYIIQITGPAAARRYFLTGERFNAHTAQKLGLVDEVVPPNELATTVSKFTQQLQQNSPAALSAAKQLIRQVAHQPLSPELFTQLSQQLAHLRTGKDAQQRLKQFFQEK